jgi:hypothetical protein
MKTIGMTFVAISALTLAGCGGGSGTTDVGAPPPSFIVWAGSSGGSNVTDGPGHQFAFFSDTGCLFNFQTGRENSAFCLSPRSNFVSYGAFHGQIVNVLVSNGTCQAAIIDSLTGNFSDIELDSFGREVVITTQLHPAICVQ